MCTGHAPSRGFPFHSNTPDPAGLLLHFAACAIDMAIKYYMLLPACLSLPRRTYLGDFLGVEQVTLFDLALDILLCSVQLRASIAARSGQERREVETPTVGKTGQTHM